MFMWAIRFFYLVAILVLIGFLWGEFFSKSSQYLIIALLLALILCYHLWNIQRLLTTLLKEEGFAKLSRKGFGSWREIYYLLQKFSTKWQQSTKQALNQQEKFIQAIQASPNGILMLDEDDQIEWCNDVAERHLGLNSKRDAMQKITYLIRQPTFTQYVLNKEYLEPIQMDGMGINSDLFLSIQIFPYGGHRKLLLSQDITQSRKNEAMRRDFVANVSHELRTPLTVLSGFLETVRELNLSDEERNRYLGLMHVQSQRMTALVEDLLILTRLESSPPPPANQVISTKVLFNQLLEAAWALSAGRHHITEQIESNFDIQGDEKEIYSAFSNLITNAIRYTPDGGTITISWIEHLDYCYFSVADTGPGISLEHLPRLTERFYRVDRSRSRDTGGTGLGLAIVKHIVTRHNAALEIQSEVGKGSTFAIRFPKYRLKLTT